MVIKDPPAFTDNIPPMPGWLAPARAETEEDVVFLAGATLATLHLVVSRAEVPQALLRDRLALSAAEACVTYMGRSERAADLRDEVHLLRAGDQPGPAGGIFQHWRRAGTVRAGTLKSLHKALPDFEPEQIAIWLDAARGGPVAQAACVLETILAAHPRAETAALILAEAALARALGWPHILPLLATGLRSRDLRTTGDDLRLACHRAVVASGRGVVQMAADLSRRAALLQAVAPKLRAKTAPAAVAQFLSRDAVAPAALTAGAGMSDRAARRLCDRLVDLGAVRELTGRDSFRLYGV